MFRSIIVYSLIFIYAGVFHSAWADRIPLNHLTPLHPQNIDIPKQTPNKTRVWIFLSSKCPCSHSHLDKLKKAFQEFSESNMEFFGVHSNQDEDPSEARSYFKKAHLEFPVFHDPGARLANFFGALKTPHVFIESPSQKILYEGGIDNSKQAPTTQENYLQDALVEIRSGHEVTRPRTRTLGCAISRSK